MSTAYDPNAWRDRDEDRTVSIDAESQQAEDVSLVAHVLTVTVMLAIFVLVLAVILGSS